MDQHRHVTKKGLHRADVAFLFVAVVVFAVVRGPLYIEIPLLFVAAFAWKHIREWIGVGRVVREEALRRKQEDSVGRR
jgi:hypothetical protein